MITFVKKRPWIWIVIAFAILIAGWVFLLRLASENRPQSVEIITIETDDEPGS